MASLKKKHSLHLRINLKLMGWSGRGQGGKALSRSENWRKWVLTNRHSRDWELYSSRLHTESYNTPHWSDRQTVFPRIL